MKRIRLTPTLLALALACFFLPWFEFRCDMGTMTQSGLQRARGNWTIVPADGHEAGQRQSFDPETRHSDPSAAMYAASVISGLCIALFFRVYPWRQFLLTAATTSALVCLGLVARNYYISTEPIAEAPMHFAWRFTPWFFATWAINAAALASVVREISSCVRQADIRNSEAESARI